MDRSGLRKWIILSHLTDEDLQNISYLVVYGSDRCTDEGLSSLFITKNGKVYGTGYNSLVGRGSSPLEFAQGDTEFLARHVKVKQLCGLGLKKIVVGFNFGAGLTSENELYVWGELDMTVNDEAIIVKYECYQPDKSCPTCGKVYVCDRIGGFDLNKCKSCSYPHYTFNTPIPPNTPCRSFLIGMKVHFPCLKCGLKCDTKKLVHKLNYCKQCCLLRENVGPITKSMLAPRKVDLSDSYRVMDIECGRDFLVMRTVSGNLLIWGKIGLNYYKGLIDNPDGVLATSISCGASHIAVVSHDGKLYTCGVGNKGQLGYKWNSNWGFITLMRVPLSGKVVKACCRATGTICLTANGVVLSFGNSKKKWSRRVYGARHRFERDSPFNPIIIPGKFTDIACSSLSNVFCAKSEPSVFSWGLTKADRRSKKTRFGHSDCLEALAGLPITFSSNDVLPNNTSKPLPTEESSDFAFMYGNDVFSDFTFKLRDSEFHAHRVVLYTRSNHFRKYFDENKSHSVLDVTSFNPDAYRSLLKYYYRVPHDELNHERFPDHLCDLHDLAVCYNENDLIQDTMQRLKHMVNEETALALYCLGQKRNMDFLVKECNPFMGAYGVWGAYCIEDSVSPHRNSSCVVE